MPIFSLKTQWTYIGCGLDSFLGPMLRHARVKLLALLAGILMIGSKKGFGAINE